MLTSILSIVLLFLIFFVAYSFATRDLFFTKINSGDIKFAIKGDSLTKIIHDVKGKKLNESGEFIEGNEFKSFLASILGIWWIGIPPFISIHKFRIKKEKENIGGNEPDSWITKGEEVIVSSLRYAFPRPFVFKAVELKDRTTVDLLVVCKFEVVNPYKLIFIFKGDFFDNTGSMLSARINDEVRNFEDIKDFINAEKSEEKGFLFPLKQANSNFNSQLTELIGLRLVGINVSKYDPSDKAVLAATNKEAIAKLEAKAIIATANGYKEKINIETQADANRITELGKAQGKKVNELVANLAGSLGDRNVIATSVATILKAEEISKSKLTTWVENGSTQTVVPVGGSK